MAEPSQKLSSHGKSADSDTETINRFVDWAMGLILDVVDEDRVQSAFYNIEIDKHSLNQTMGFASLCPMWLYLELKRMYQPKDPRIQLGIFASAGILKRNRMGWDISFPTPGITVDGHLWRLYIFYFVHGKTVSSHPCDVSLCIITEKSM
ncbi:MAG: hypothetical protein Q9218_002998 [Villophora microphyllina]